MELTTAITKYVNSRLEVVNRFLNDDQALVYVEVAKTTNHHNKGEIYKAEIDIRSKGNKFYVVSEKTDLYKAINDAKEQVSKELKRKLGRQDTLFKRGATSVKKMIKGLSKRNPFTSKYE